MFIATDHAKFELAFAVLDLFFLKFAMNKQPVFWVAAFEIHSFIALSIQLKGSVTTK
jgi:hypothetical protein